MAQLSSLDRRLAYKDEELARVRSEFKVSCDQLTDSERMRVQLTSDMQARSQQLY